MLAQETSWFAMTNGEWLCQVVAFGAVIWSHPSRFRIQRRIAFAWIAVGGTRNRRILYGSRESSCDPPENPPADQELGKLHFPTVNQQGGGVVDIQNSTLASLLKAGIRRKEKGEGLPTDFTSIRWVLWDSWSIGADVKRLNADLMTGWR
jgi:hypothetical protein